MINKPPLGIIPKKYFEEQRVMEICRALNDYAQYAQYNKNESTYEYMIRWAEELTERLNNLKFELEFENENELSHNNKSLCDNCPNYPGCDAVCVCTPGYKVKYLNMV